MPQVMDGIEHAAKHFTTLVQVMQIRTREVLAGIAITGWIKRVLIVAMHRIADLDDTRLSEQMPIACITRWHHAIEHIHATPHTFHQILGLANTHQVTGFF